MGWDGEGSGERRKGKLSRLLGSLTDAVGPRGCKTVGKDMGQEKCTSLGNRMVGIMRGFCQR